MEYTDHIFPVKVGANAIVQINPRTGKHGVIELQSVEGGALFLFQGALTAADCEAALKGENPDFHLAAAVAGSSKIKMQRDIGTLTVFSKKESLGFVKITEC